MALVYNDESYAINGAAMDVYNHLGLLLNFGSTNGLVRERIVCN